MLGWNGVFLGLLALAVPLLRQDVIINVKVRLPLLSVREKGAGLLPKRL